MAALSAKARAPTPDTMLDGREAAVVTIGSRRRGSGGCLGRRQVRSDASPLGEGGLSMRRTALLCATAVLAGWLGARASAQHATAFDIEDGKRVFQTSCANCHGPDGNLIAGIDFGRGVFRRPFTNDELAD